MTSTKPEPPTDLSATPAPAPSAGAILTVLIPVYQRFDGALRASLSVVAHNRSDLEAGHIRLVVCDDASPAIDAADLHQKLAAIHPAIEFRRNPSNLGMSANILAMVSSCRSFYSTILTDDDWYEPGALSTVLQLLQSFVKEHNITSILSPRYSYLETGELVTVSCRIQEGNHLFQQNSKGPPLALAEGAYILSGYFFRPDCIDYNLWRQHVHNAFFPILYCASILQTGATFYLDQPLVHHTTQNQCHWQAWGASDQAQQIRLCHDYLQALAIVSRYRRPQKASRSDRSSAQRERARAYGQRLIEKREVVLADLRRSVPRSLWRDPAFLQAFGGYLYFLLRTSPRLLLGPWLRPPAGDRP